MGYRVFSTVPDGWEDLIEEAKKIEGWKEVSDYIRELIKKDLVSKGLLGVRNNSDSEVEVTA